MRSGAVMLAGEFTKALLADEDVEIRAQVCKIIGDAVSHRALGPRLIPLLLDPNPRVRFQAAIAIGKLGVPDATDALLELARINDDKDAYLRHAVVTGLTGTGDQKALDAASHSGFASVRRAVALTWHRRHAHDIAKLLYDKEDSIASEAARAVHDDESIPDALAELASLLYEPRAWPDAVARRTLNANFRIGGKENAERVLNYALRMDAPIALRTEALTLVKLWSNPPPLDRVDGRVRGLEARSPEIITGVALPYLDALMALKEPALKSTAIQIAILYRLPVPAKAAAAVAMDSKASAEVRVETLKLLADQHSDSEELAKALDELAIGKTTPENLRITALGIMLASKPDAAVTQLTQLLSSGTTLEKQKSCSLLAAAKTDAADAALLKEMDQLIAGKCPASRQLDLLEAVKSRSADLPALAEKLNSFEAPRAPLAATPAAFTECLEGGSSTAGKEIVKEHLAANCIACHRFDSKEGSNVGPLLSSIGAQKDRKYLLESLVSPMAKIAPGYGMVVVSLKDGKSLSGSLVSKDDKNVVLRLADGKVSKTDSAEIAGMTDPISVMPPMSAILTKRELRDVVAYLAGLKGKSSEVAANPATPAAKGKTATTKGKSSAPKGKAPAPKGKSPSKKKK